MLQVEGAEPEIHVSSARSPSGRNPGCAPRARCPLFCQQAGRGAGTPSNSQVLVEAGQHQPLPANGSAWAPGNGLGLAPMGQAQRTGPAPLQLGGDPRHQGDGVEQPVQPLAQGRILQQGICRPEAGSSNPIRARTHRAWCRVPGCHAPAAGGSPAAPPAPAASRCRSRRAGRIPVVVECLQAQVQGSLAVTR